MSFHTPCSRSSFPLSLVTAATLWIGIPCALFGAFFLFSPPAHAASSVIVSTGNLPNGQFPGAPIKANSPTVPILKIGVTASAISKTLTSVTIDFSGTGFATSDLAAIDTATSSGVSLYADNGTVPGTFDTSDQLVTLTSSDWSTSSVRVILTPATTVNLTNGVEKIFYVAVRTSGTIAENNLIVAAIPSNGIVTSDGSGPSAPFTASDYRADTTAPVILDVEGYTSSTSLSVRFSEPVQKIGGGNLSVGDAALPFTDGGGTVQSLTLLTHAAGQSLITLTIDGPLEPADLDGSPASVAIAEDAIIDMAGNVAAATSTNVASPISINTPSFPAATAGAAYTGDSPLIQLSTQGGAAPYVWSIADATSTSILNSLSLTLSTSTGKLTGTVANLSGSYFVIFKSSDSLSASTTRGYTINVAPAGGGGVPGLASVSPSGATLGQSNLSVMIRGTNTSFNGGTSQVEILLPPGTPGVNGITVGTVSVSNTSTLTLPVSVDPSAATGARDVKVTTGNQAVTLPGGFFVGAAVGAGLNLLFPTDNATGLPLPPGFSFTHTADNTVVSYRVTIKASSEPAAMAIWDYVFPKTTDGTGHCSADQCQLNYGSGVYRILKQPTILNANTDYYWQIRTYATTSAAVSDNIIPREITPSRKFTTTASITDTVPPNIQHRPLFHAAQNTNLTLVARIFDNVANASTTPALSASVFYCAGSGCDPTTSANATYIGAGYFSFPIPSATIGNAGTIVRYYLRTTDGTNIALLKSMDGSPFQLTSSAAGTLITSGTVRDNTNTCVTGIQGAYVFAEGSGFSTTTNESCAFSLMQLFPGTYDLVAVKEGFSDRRIEGLPASSTGIGLQLTSGFMGGFGGDTSKPQIKFTGPSDGMNGLPGSDSNFKAFLVFNKTMSQSSVTQLGNLVVKEINPATGLQTDITSKGTWTFYPSAPGIPGIPPEPNVAVWALNTPNTLGDGKTFVIIATAGVTDTSGNTIQGNQPDGSYAIFFTTGMAFTGSFGAGETFGAGAFTPPRVTGSTPPPGSISVPLNTKIVLNFSESMSRDEGGYMLKNSFNLFRLSDAGTETNITSAAVLAVTLDSTTKNATVTLASGFNGGVFESNTKYRLKVLGSAKAASGLSLAPPDMSSMVVYQSDFKTGTTSDTAAPTIIGTYPDQGAASVPVNVGALSIAFSKDMDISTLSTNTLYLSIGSSAVNGTMEYRPLERMAFFVPKSVLNPNTTYTLNVTTDVKGLNGTALANAMARTFTTGGADSTGPKLAFVNADEYRIALSFSEPVNAAKIVDTINWTSSVLNPDVYNVLKYGDAGFNPASAGTVISLSSARFSYEAFTNTVIIEGISLPSAAIGKELYLSLNTTGNVLRDQSGNLLDETGASVRTTLQNSAMTMGALGPMAMSSDAFSTMGGFVPTNFSTSTFGFAPPVEARPFNMMAGQTTNYGIRIPISKQIPTSGVVVLTFASGFDVSGAKQDINSPMRTDMNGPGTGAITFKCATNVAGGKSCAGTANADDTGAAQGGLADDGVVVNPSARTVTVYLSAATNVAGHDFLGFDLAGIKNSTVPKDFNTSGYTVDVKTMNGSTLLESMTSQAFFIQSAGAYTLSGTITATGNDQNGTMQVYLMSPMTGPMQTISADFAGGTTAAYSFSSIPSGEFFLFTDPSISLGNKDFVGKTIPERVSVNATTTYNFTLANTDASGTTVTVTVVGPADAMLDIFAGSPTGFKAKQVTLDNNAGNTESFTMKLADGEWFLGVGPQMPKGPMAGPPPTPDYVMPKPKNIKINGATCAIEGVAGCTVAFTLTTATKTIKGTVQDTSGRVMANAEVYAYSPTGGIGTRTTTDATGTFTLKVNDGSYIVGTFVPGMAPSQEIPVTVTADATTYLLVGGSNTAITPAVSATSFILKIAKPDYTISGKITDGTNVVQGASVYAYRTDAPGHVNAISDSSGAYTLYVANGSWKVGVFLPQYGNLTEQTVTVSGASVSNLNFSPSQTGTFSAVSGRVYKDLNANASYDTGEALQGAFIRLSGNGAFNEAISGTDGAYSFKVAAGSGYILQAFAPGIGELPPLAAFTVSGDTSNKDIVVATPNTVTYVFSTSIQEAFIEAFSATGIGGRAQIKNATSTTMSLPAGSYRLNVFSPGAPISTVTDVVASTENTAYVTSTGVFTVDGAESLTITLPTLRTVTGTVTDGSAALADAWIELMNPTSGVHFGTKTGSDGTFTLMAADAATAYRINAMKPGYVREPSNLTINGADLGGQTVAMAVASFSIRGQVLIGSTGAANAFVRAERQGGGFAGTQADANGNYTLYVTPGSWKIYAVAEGYAEVAYGNGSAVTLTNASLTGKDVTLTTTVSLNPPKTKPITPASGGTLEDTTAGIKLTIPANALGSDASAGNVQAKETNNVRETSSARPLGGKAQELKATNASGNPITTFNDNVTVEMTYTKTELNAIASESDGSIDTTSEVNKLKMAYWDETSQNWVTLASTITYKNGNGDIIANPASNLSDTVSVTITTVTDHFSLYAPVVSTDPSAPTTPTGLTATALSTSQARLNWTLTSGATGYNIYRSTVENSTYTRIGSEPTVNNGDTVTYTDTGLNQNTRYFYKITSLNDSGESASSDAVSVQTQSSGGGGSGGGGSASVSTPTAIVTTPTASTTTSVSTPQTSSPAPVKAPSTTTAPVSSAPISVIPAASVTFKGLPSSMVWIQGSRLEATYTYVPTEKNASRVIVTREWLNGNGKLIKKASTIAKLKSGESFNGRIRESIAKKMAPGRYSMRVRIQDAISKKILDEQTFTFQVKAPVKMKWKAGTQTQTGVLRLQRTALTGKTDLPSTLTIKYQIASLDQKPTTIFLTREFVDAAGKVVSASNGTRTVAGRATVAVVARESLPLNLGSGLYTMKIEAKTKDGNVVGTASLEIDLKEM